MPHLLYFSEFQLSNALQMMPRPNNEELWELWGQELLNLNIHIGLWMQNTLSKIENGVWLFRWQYSIIMQLFDDSKPFHQSYIMS